MIVRLALLLLVAVLIAGIIGRWMNRRIAPRAGRAIEAAHKCPDCGAYVLAGEVCPCTRG